MSAAKPAGSAATSLELHPFPGMRYNAELVGDIGEVTSPPYDVMDRPMIDRLLNEHARNIVRLILPRMVSDPVNDAEPYRRAARQLDRWRTRRILLTDEAPALYVYQYGDATHTVCGLVGALGLHPASDHVVLPHEDVIAGIVADRLAMMSASQSNLEPILLVYDGGGAATEFIDEARSQSPLIDVNAIDGTFHRLWAISDPERLAEIARRLAPHQALIADGHHRYATYLQLQQQQSADGSVDGPWDRGLALLIDQSQCPLQLGAIHRAIADFSLDAVVPPAGFSMTAERPVKGLPPLPTSKGQFVVTDGRSQRLLVQDAEPDHAVSDAEVLHTVLLPSWTAAEDRVSYHHTLEQAVRNARQEGGVAVLVHPATVAEVMDVARAGKIMPRKSTSFGPKPRMGLIMRSFADETASDVNGHDGSS